MCVGHGGTFHLVALFLELGRHIVERGPHSAIQELRSLPQRWEGTQLLQSLLPGALWYLAAHRRHGWPAQNLTLALGPLHAQHLIEGCHREVSDDSHWQGED